MLKKLFKQEWKSFFPAPTITMIVLAVVTLILMSTFMTSFWEQENNIFVDLFASLTIIAYAFCLAALSFCVMICTAVRFYKNLFTDEGYLMFTLPVKASDLLLSKLLVATCFRLIAAVFTILSILGVASVAILYISDTSVVQFLKEFVDLFGEALTELQEYMPIPIPFLFFWLLALGACSLLFSTLFLYACICLGQLWSKHKIGGAIIAYFSLRFIMRSFRQLFSVPLSEIFSSYYEIENITAGTWLLLMFISLLVMGGLCVGMYCICNYIMSKKLNLE